MLLSGITYITMCVVLDFIDKKKAYDKDLDLSATILNEEVNFLRPPPNCCKAILHRNCHTTHSGM